MQKKRGAAIAGHERKNLRPLRTELRTTGAE
jgi:hypothetical protein